VTEFVNSCVYVFAKHAYDVGDFVAVKGLKLVVTEVHLTHTNFEEVNSPDERGKVVQISHAALSSETITNWTRSADVLQEEQEDEHAPAAGATP
jgi:small-conductance mechanosensitive channel